MKFSKNVNNKKHVSELIFFNEKKWEMRKTLKVRNWHFSIAWFRAEVSKLFWIDCLGFHNPLIVSLKKNTNNEKKCSKDSLKKHPWICILGFCRECLQIDFFGPHNPFIQTMKKKNTNDAHCLDLNLIYLNDQKISNFYWCIPGVDATQ